MLSDNEQAVAYAFAVEAKDKVEQLLNAVEPALLEDDWEIVKELGVALTKVEGILDVR